MFSGLAHKIFAKLQADCRSSQFSPRNSSDVGLMKSSSYITVLKYSIQNEQSKEYVFLHDNYCMITIRV